MAAALSEWPGAAGPHPTVQALALESDSADRAKAQVPSQRGVCGATMTLGLCPVPPGSQPPQWSRTATDRQTGQPQRVPLQET